MERIDLDMELNAKREASVEENRETSTEGSLSAVLSTSKLIATTTPSKSNIEKSLVTYVTPNTAATSTTTPSESYDEDAFNKVR